MQSLIELNAAGESRLLRYRGCGCGVAAAGAVAVAVAATVAVALAAASGYNVDLRPNTIKNKRVQYKISHFLLSLYVGA